MATAKKKAAPEKGKWVPPWAKKAAPAKAGAKAKKPLPKKASGGSMKKGC
jgi:hypothetical protein